MILPATDEDDASFIAEEMRSILAEKALAHEGNTPPTVTVSIGISTVSASDCKRSTEELVRRADHALYEAKRAGRNRSLVWHEPNQTKNSSAA